MCQENEQLKKALARRTLEVVFLKAACAKVEALRQANAGSGKVIGWALERNLTARLPLLALERAITERQPEAGLVHHSDRGVQYASDAYTQVLRLHGILPSMSRPANPYDTTGVPSDGSSSMGWNAACESFIKTLKQKEIHASHYRDLDDLRVSIEEFLEHYYNRLRLHSALGYTTPEQFEAQHPTHTSTA